jgi:dihydroorotate dehydrogenase
MPDWSYRTVFRPLLFRLPARLARDLTLRIMGTLARMPFGPHIIEFLGHMRPDPRLARTLLDQRFASSVGLGPGIDVNAVALPALARFGFGFLELGPITLAPVHGSVDRRQGQQAIGLSMPLPNPGPEIAAKRLAELRSTGLPLIARLDVAVVQTPTEAVVAVQKLISALGAHADLLSLTIPAPALAGQWTQAEWSEFMAGSMAAARAVVPCRPVLLCVPAACDATATRSLTEIAINHGITGIIIDGTVREGDAVLVGRPARESTLAMVRQIRSLWGPHIALIASGGIHEPQDALDLLNAGADLVQVDSGLVYGGPGLAKRINDAVLSTQQTEAPVDDGRPVERSWFWTALLGISMLVGGLLATVIAASRVVLHYDEAFAGLSRQQLADANVRLLPFLTHDRVSLAGTMIAVGVLYIGLAMFGVRQGRQWARLAIVTSAFAGFGSFFLFLGFGYLEPFHAFVTAILFQFLLLGLHCRLSPPVPEPPVDLREDWRWRLGLWGQLFFIVHGAILIVAGSVISIIGVTTVFVPEDLEFMDTTADELARAAPRLIPLIAHDRATFGGMLIACGITVLLASLWGYRAGRRWLWWTLLLAGLPAYIAAIGVHVVVGYTNNWHLTPAFGGAALLVIGSALSRPYLAQKIGVPTTAAQSTGS